jgi:hypothetical protein
MNEAASFLRKQALRWRLRTILQSLCLGFAGSILVMVLTVSPVAALAAGCAAAGVYLALRRPWRVNAQIMALSFDRNYPQLGESCTLLLRSELPPLAALQRARTAAALKSIRPDPPRLLPFALIALIALGLGTIITALRSTTAPVQRVAHSGAQPPTMPAEMPAIRSASIAIAPPAYTNLPLRQIGELNFQAEEGSRVEWRVVLTSPSATAAIRLPGGRLLAMASDGAALMAAAEVHSSGVYEIQVRNGQVGKSYFHTLQTIPDRSPQLTFLTPAENQTFRARPQGKSQIHVGFSDDYGIARLTLQITLARGTGENIEFNTSSLPLAVPAGSTRGEAATDISLEELLQNPGDEIYLRVEAADQVQTARSETRYLRWNTETSGLEAGLAVTVLPAYFRSQRQIIIDTEKLLAEKAAIAPEKFQRRSNDLAVDQKLLRLRYGQFLGEEFEQSAVGSQTARGDSGNVTIISRFGHLHDQGADIRVSAGRTDAEEAPQQNYGDAESIRRSQTHTHDSVDQATFFDPEVKADLRAVLQAMWDAERELRLVRPEDSLPFQRNALDRLKALQQKDRIFVKRTSLELPPLRPDELRYRGDLTGINSKREHSTTTGEPDGIALAGAYRAIDELAHPETRHDAADRIRDVLIAVLARGSGREAAPTASKIPPTQISQGPARSETELLIRELNDPDTTPDLAERARAIVWKLLPKATAAPKIDPALKTDANFE